MNRPAKRAVDGILLLDKPTGMTSNAALQRVKHMYRARKAGHTGSLDPLASGLLPLCLGEATKLSSWLLDADKEYVVACRFGERTDTADADGSVIERCALPEREAVERAVPGLVGDIEQVPPMYSALKHQGKRLYEIARSGTEVERKPRQVTIHALEILGWPDEATVELRVACSKGTYVRTLVEDLARAAGSCGHVTALRRTRSGPFLLEEGGVSAEQLEAAAAQDGEAGLDALLLPVDAALSDWPKVVLGDDAAFFLRQGQPVVVSKAPQDRMLRLYGPDGRFLGIGAVQDDGRVAPKRLIATS